MQMLVAKTFLFLSFKNLSHSSSIWSHFCNAIQNNNNNKRKCWLVTNNKCQQIITNSLRLRTATATGSLHINTKYISILLRIHKWKEREIKWIPFSNVVSVLIATNKAVTVWHSGGDRASHDSWGSFVIQFRVGIDDEDKILLIVLEVRLLLLLLLVRL